MVASTHYPQTPAERLIAATIEWTWPLWLVGGLYIVGPALGWVLAAMAVAALYVGTVDPKAIPRTVWLWLACMAAMLIILWIGHANFDLGIGKTIKSSVGWAKGWALIALFPLAGAALNIRPEIVYRAVCHLGLQTLILVPLFVLAPTVGLPEKLWISPLKALGGAGPDYFTAQLYTIEPGVGRPRWQFFAPWSPAAGMMGVIYALIAMRERHIGWRSVGIAAGLALAVLSQSRLALVALVVAIPAIWAASRLDRGYIWLLAAPMALALGVFGPVLFELFESASAEFYAARADSSRVRAALGRIAIDRWQMEAYWFGHGVVENGPHLVEYMPIGSHHSWYGLLFVKGLIGTLTFAVPLIVTLGGLVIKSVWSETAKIGFAMTLLLVFYSFGENLEILAYLYWPALVLIGIGLQSRS